MEAVRRGINGKRLFTPDFKREQVSRVVRGEVTAAELGRKLGIASAMVRRWKHLIERGAKMAVSANEDLVPVSTLRAAERRIRELENGSGALRRSMVAATEFKRVRREYTDLTEAPGPRHASSPQRTADQRRSQR